MESSGSTSTFQVLICQYFRSTLRSDLIDLSVLQIYSEIRPENYRDNCFVYACIQSGVFTKEEIDYLRSYVQTRKLPNSLIKEIAETMRCHFVVKRIDENKDVNHQMLMFIDTRKIQERRSRRT